MWPTKDERETLVFYYKEWDVRGNSSFLCKKPMNERMDRRLRDQGLILTDVSVAENDIRVSLTPEGRRLGRIYSSSCFVWSGLWFAEYKDHWFWLILSFLGGIIGSLLVNWLS
jgi:hypothetical protein